MASRGMVRISACRVLTMESAGTATTTMRAKAISSELASTSKVLAGSLGAFTGASTSPAWRGTGRGKPQPEPSLAPSTTASSSRRPKRGSRPRHLPGGPAETAAARCLRRQSPYRGAGSSRRTPPEAPGSAPTCPPGLRNRRGRDRTCDSPRRYETKAPSPPPGAREECPRLGRPHPGCGPSGSKANPARQTAAPLWSENSRALRPYSNPPGPPPRPEWCPRCLFPGSRRTPPSPRHRDGAQQEQGQLGVDSSFFHPRIHRTSGRIIGQVRGSEPVKEESNRGQAPTRKL